MANLEEAEPFVNGEGHETQGADSVWKYTMNTMGRVYIFFITIFIVAIVSVTTISDVTLLGNVLIAFCVFFVLLTVIMVFLLMCERRDPVIEHDEDEEEYPALIIDFPPSYEEALKAKVPETPPPAYEYVLHV